MTTFNFTRLIKRNLVGLLRRISILLPLALLFQIPVKAQERIWPNWWFGVAGAANFDFYRGTTQIMNDNLTLPYAFKNGFGVAPYGAVLVEYRPERLFGLMLYFAYDGREGQFSDVDSPNPPNSPGRLDADFDYLAFEPSLRIAPFSGNFYLFIGPRFSFNINNSFTYEPPSAPNNEAKWSDVYGVRVSAQVGLGYDIPITSVDSRTQVELSPFVSFLPYFGEQPRSLDNLTLTTVRAGIALKFGCAHKRAAEGTSMIVLPVVDTDVQFSVQAPGPLPSNTTVVKETLPLCNYIFFDAGSTQIPSRYTLLTKDQAAGFSIAQLQDCQKTPGTRSMRQITMYHNVLNILADRMRRHPSSTIKLIGSSAGKGVETGKANADAVKNYLVNTFGISAGRITTEGRNMPLIPSEQPNDTNDVLLTSAEDNRVDIVSNSHDLMMEVKDNSAPCLQPLDVIAVNENNTDSYKITIHANGANRALKSWWVDVTDGAGNRHHFGPFTGDDATILASAVINDQSNGNYTIVMTGKAKTGETIHRESTFSLSRSSQPMQPEHTASILFAFDKSVTVSTFRTFLADTVAPHITPNSTVIISGYTDIVGEKEHNLALSQNRAHEAQNILDSALAKNGTTGVTYQTNGFGESDSAFSNTLPEERFYNRTVIINIVPGEVSLRH